MAGEYDLGTAKGTIELNASSLARAASSLNLVGNKMLLVGGLAVAGFGLAVKASADFEQQLSRFKAVTNSSGEEMDILRKKALQLGRDSAFGAGEVTKGFVEIGKAGLSARDVINGVGDAAVYLAAAGEIDMTRATEILVNVMRQFHIPAKDAVDISNLLAGAANASTLEVEDLAVSLRYVGPVAAAAGLTFRSTAEALAILGNAGIKGSTAGTSLRGILIGLASQSPKATAAMKELGFITEDGSNKFFDAQGHMRKFSEVAEILRGGLGGVGKQLLDVNGKLKSTDEINKLLEGSTTSLTDKQKIQAVVTIFQRRAMASALVLAKEGKKGFDDLAHSNQFATTAQEVMQTKLDNVNGSLKILKSSVETFAIVLGSAFQGPLKFVIDLLREFTNILISLPQPVLTILASIVALGGAFLVIGGLIARFGGAAVLAYKAFRDLGNAVRLAYAIIANGSGPLSMMGKIGAGFAALGAGIIIGKVIYDAFGPKGAGPMIEGLQKVEAAAKGLASVNNSELVPSFQKVVRQQIESEKAFNDQQRSWFGHGNTIVEVRKKYQQLLASFTVFKQLADENFGKAAALAIQLKTLGINTSLMDQYLARIAPHQKAANEAQHEGAVQAALLTGSYEDQIEALDELQDKLNGVYDVTFAQIHAQEAQADALKDLTEKQQAAANAGYADAEANEAANRQLVVAEEAIIKAAAATRDKVQADQEALGATDAHKQAVFAQISQLGTLAATLEPGSPLRVFLEQYIERLKATEADRVAHVGVEIDPAALAALKILNDQLDALQRKGSTVVPDITGLEAAAKDEELRRFYESLGHSAQGGPVSGPGFVGEQGVELFSKKGWITSNDDLRRMMYTMQQIKKLQSSIPPMPAGLAAGLGGAGSDPKILTALQTIAEQVRNMDGPLVGEMHLNGTGKNASDGLEMVRELRSLSWRGRRRG